MKCLTCEKDTKLCLRDFPFLLRRKNGASDSTSNKRKNAVHVKAVVSCLGGECCVTSIINNKLNI